VQCQEKVGNGPAKFRLILYSQPLSVAAAGWNEWGDKNNYVHTEWRQNDFIPFKTRVYIYMQCSKWNYCNSYSHERLREIF